MRPRPPALVALAVAAALPLSARADPLDLDLERLGPPDPFVWRVIDASLSAADSERLAADSLTRFALLSSELALALTSFSLTPPDTTGEAAFEISLEAGFAQVHRDKIGGGVVGHAARDYWPTHGPTPATIALPALHVRKGLPFSFELGARLFYLNQTRMMAGQAEARWALNEGFRWIPELAVRGAITRLVGQRDWDLTMADLDVVLGKRFGVLGVMSLTPYVLARWSWMNAQTGVIDFAPSKAASSGGALDVTATQTLFPELAMGSHRFLRYSGGLRLITYVSTLAVEGTYFPGAKLAAATPYPAFTLKRSWSGAFKLGLIF